MHMLQVESLVKLGSLLKYAPKYLVKVTNFQTKPTQATPKLLDVPDPFHHPLHNRLHQVHQRPRGQLIGILACHLQVRLLLLRERPQVGLLLREDLHLGRQVLRIGGAQALRPLQVRVTAIVVLVVVPPREADAGAVVAGEDGMGHHLAHGEVHPRHAQDLGGGVEEGQREGRRHHGDHAGVAQDVAARLGVLEGHHRFEVYRQVAARPSGSR